MRNNDLFSTFAASRLGLKMSLFLTQAEMKFVLERRNGRKRSNLDQCVWDGGRSIPLTFARVAKKEN